MFSHNWSQYCTDTCTLEINKVHTFFFFFFFSFAVTRSGQLQLCCPAPSSFWWSVSQLAKLHIFPGHAFYSFGINAPWSVNLLHQIDKHLTVPSLLFYSCVRSTGCFLFSISPLSLGLAYSIGGRHISLDLASKALW